MSNTSEDNIMRQGDRPCITLTLNGRERSGYCEPRDLLSDFIRHELGATGTHVG
ncbi:MAG: 2-furoyl-CoA dehydrogenase 2Fe-2S iron sulfur subunit, partial [Paraburkholderia sp.]|nr:2-furoyl-CoA dehydrogenase 2Fe-2S iron sulfur subunit [Paraburkholderia sp.]